MLPIIYDFLKNAIEIDNYPIGYISSDKYTSFGFLMDFNGRRPIINHMMVRVRLKKLDSSVRKRKENDLLVGSFEPTKRLQGLHFLTMITKNIEPLHKAKKSVT